MLADPGPNWADIMTALGTVGATIAALIAAGVAVWVAVWTDRRADRRLAEEREAAEKRLAEERKAADERLRRELDHSAAQLQKQMESAQHQEQLAEAYQVQVTQARKPPSRESRDPAEPIARGVAIVINRGRYTITRVEARYFVAGNITSFARTEHLTSWMSLPPQVREDGELLPARMIPGRDSLTPADSAIRFTTDDTAEKYLRNYYPIVRWQDHRGTWWEHKKGVVREISDGAQWEP